MLKSSRCATAAAAAAYPAFEVRVKVFQGVGVNESEVCWALWLKWLTCRWQESSIIVIWPTKYLRSPTYMTQVRNANINYSPESNSMLHLIACRFNQTPARQTNYSNQARGHVKFDLFYQSSSRYRADTWSLLQLVPPGPAAPSQQAAGAPIKERTTCTYKPHQFHLLVIKLHSALSYVQPFAAAASELWSNNQRTARDPLNHGMLSTQLS